MVRVGGSERSEEQEEDFIKDEAMVWLTEAGTGSEVAGQRLQQVAG